MYLRCFSSFSILIRSPTPRKFQTVVALAFKHDVHVGLSSEHLILSFLHLWQPNRERFILFFVESGIITRHILPFFWF